MVQPLRESRTWHVLPQPASPSRPAGAAAEAPVVETPPPPSRCPARPALHLLPLCIGRMAEHADVPGLGQPVRAQWRAGRVQGRTTRSPRSRPTRSTGPVEGQCVTPPDEYPDDLIPAWPSAQRLDESHHPSRVWRESFSKAKRLTCGRTRRCSSRWRSSSGRTRRRWRRPIWTDAVRHHAAH